jgi:hypothetical protein
VDERMQAHGPGPGVKGGERANPRSQVTGIVGGFPKGKHIIKPEGRAFSNKGASAALMELSSCS